MLASSVPERTGQRCAPSRMVALKFRQFVRPGDTLELTLDWQPDKGRLVFELKGPDGICASGRLVLAAHRES